VVAFFVEILAGLPPISTAVASLRFVPVIVTSSPWQIIVGVKEVIVGSCAHAGKAYNNNKTIMIQ